MTCPECYSDKNRITPLLKPLYCLQNHTQYICSTCGRCICIEHDSKRGLQRWNFPFHSLEIAKYYLRTADYTVKSPCGIYKMKSNSGRTFYKIFARPEDLQVYLAKNKNKHCETMMPVFSANAYYAYPNTQIRKLTTGEIEQYMAQRGHKTDVTGQNSNPNTSRF